MFSALRKCFTSFEISYRNATTVMKSVATEFFSHDCLQSSYVVRNANAPMEDGNEQILNQFYCFWLTNT